MALQSAHRSADLSAEAAHRLDCSLLHAAMKTTNDRQATAELLAAVVEGAIVHGRRHYSESGELLATTLAVLECLRREGFVTVEDPATS